MKISTTGAVAWTAVIVAVFTLALTELFRVPEQKITQKTTTPTIEKTIIPSDPTTVWIDINEGLLHAIQANDNNKPDQAIDALIDAITKNHKSNATRDSHYYRLEADLYYELAKSLGLKGDKEQQQQAATKSQKARTQQIYFEKLKREEGLRRVLQTNQSPATVATKDAQTPPKQPIPK